MANTTALPAWRYGDPADIVEHDQMDTMGCWACKSHQYVFANSMCGDSRNEHQKGVPNIGHRCKLFVEKD